MRRHRLMLSAGTALFLAAGVPHAGAETFRWAGQTDPSTMDPHAAAVAPVLSFLNNVYEGLVRRGPDMAIEPSLAVSWEPLEAEPGWRFHLREGVTFHDGAAFTADDVQFSYERAITEQSDVGAWFASVTEFRVVDDTTVEFVTDAPNPLFPESIANFLIMDRDWAEANGAMLPAREEESFATLNANGTGPFRLAEREPGIRSVLEPNADWWDVAQHNLTEVVFTPISVSSTGVAALLSGEIDFFEPVPLQDVGRVDGTDGFSVLQGPEARVIFLGFAHDRDSLHTSDLEGVNPFQDARVRRAIYHAVDAAPIVATVMRGAAQPAALLVGPGMGGYAADLDERLAHDPDRARELLAEAGYPDGFRFGLRCPNDRYINDEEVCTAVTGMLDRIGLDVDLITMPVAGYWDELRAGNYDMYLLGWSPGTFDVEHPIRFLLHTPDPDRRLGSWNFGGYSNPRVDELLPQIQTELDPATRQAMIDEIHTIVRDDAVYVPIHVQPLVWAMRDGVEVLQRPDNFFMLRYVTVTAD